MIQRTENVRGGGLSSAVGISNQVGIGDPPRSPQFNQWSNFVDAINNVCARPSRLPTKERVTTIIHLAQFCHTGLNHIYQKGIHKYIL